MIDDTAVVAGFTHRRSSGSSAPPYDDANLALHVGDDPDRVAENRRRFAHRRGVDAADAVWMDQVHGSHVVTVSGRPVGTTVADGLVTAVPGLLLAVLVADCVPVVLTSAEAVGVVHAGRRGAAAGIVPAALTAMAAAGATEVLARLGPAICGRCYEVPDEVRDEVEQLLPGSACRTRQGTGGLDLRAGIATQLAAAGVAVEVSDSCTFEAPHLFSFRRDGVTGRQAGYALLTP